MTKSALPNTIATTANIVGHMAAHRARTGQPLPMIQLADGRTRMVRGAMFRPLLTTLLYTLGPSDTCRHDASVDLLPDDNPCANCTRDLAEHDGDDLRTCKTQHLYHLVGQR